MTHLSPQCSCRPILPRQASHPPRPIGDYPRSMFGSTFVTHPISPELSVVSGLPPFGVGRISDRHRAHRLRRHYRRPRKVRPVVHITTCCPFEYAPHRSTVYIYPSFFPALETLYPGSGTTAIPIFCDLYGPGSRGGVVDAPAVRGVEVLPAIAGCPVATGVHLGI